jgi:hypothetical protein
MEKNTDHLFVLVILTTSSYHCTLQRFVSTDPKWVLFHDRIHFYQYINS